MPIIPSIAAMQAEMTEWRHDFHAHPELGFEETRTADLVASRLAGWGLEVHRGLARTGVVGVLKGREPSPRTLGLRADMDALAMTEANDLPYRSQHPGRFHGCGHDGHTTMLLGAARYLAATRQFAGTVHFIFQPAEEGRGGAEMMVAEGLFEGFPCDEIYALHNSPRQPMGEITVLTGPVGGAVGEFDVTIQAKSGHAALPHLCTDPVVIAAQLVTALC